MGGERGYSREGNVQITVMCRGGEGGGLREYMSLYSEGAREGGGGGGGGGGGCCTTLTLP